MTQYNGYETSRYIRYCVYEHIIYLWVPEPRSSQRDLVDAQDLVRAMLKNKDDSPLDILTSKQHTGTPSFIDRGSLQMLS